MKKKLLIVTTLVYSMFAQAQSRSVVEQQQFREHLTLANELLNAQTFKNTKQKPTGLGFRVIAQVSERPGFSYDPDSTAFKYSENRAAKFNYNDLSFLYNYKYENSYAPIFHDVTDPLNLPADTILEFNSGTNIQTYSITYRPDRKRSSLIISNSVYKLKTVNEYNSQGYLVGVHNMFFPNLNDTNSKRKIVYNNTFSRVLSDSLLINNSGQFQLNVLRKYYYNSQDQLDSIIDIGGNSKKIIIKYNSEGKISNLYQRVEYTGTLDVSIQTFLYTPGIEYATTHEILFSNHDSFSPANKERYIKYPGIDGRPDSTLHFLTIDTGNEELFEKIVYKYTAFGAPESITLFGVDNPTPTINRFYYEEYDDQTSILPLSDNKNYEIYPNPFKDELIVDWKGIKQNPVTVSIYDITGRVLYNAVIKLQSGKNLLTVPPCKNGTYIIIMKDNEGKVWQKKLLKQS